MRWLSVVIVFALGCSKTPEELSIAVDEAVGIIPASVSVAGTRCADGQSTAHATFLDRSLGQVAKLQPAVAKLNPQDRAKLKLLVAQRLEIVLRPTSETTGAFQRACPAEWGAVREWTNRALDAGGLGKD